MRLCEKKPSIVNSSIYMILFLKVLSDMFYQVQIVDIMLTGCAGLLLLYSVCGQKLRFNLCDSCILILTALFTISFIKEISCYRDYVKIVSCFLLYFLGRFGCADIDKLSHTLGKAFLIAFLFNIVYCLLGFGTIVWGEAITYRGTYYFKTDFAAMISYFVLFFFTRNKKYGWVDNILFLLAAYFTVMANARIFYLIFSIMVGFILLHRKNQKLIAPKSIFVLFISAVVGVLMAILIPKLPYFAARNMLGFDVDNMADLFDGRNMQGRNVIWRTILTAFFKTDIFTQLFGAPLYFGQKYGYQGVTEHSLYVKLVINTGYVGLLVWLVFLAALVYLVWKDRNRKVEYLCGMLMTIFLIQGISVETIAYTDSSWLTMYFCGMVCRLYEQSALEK